MPKKITQKVPEAAPRLKKLRLKLGISFAAFGLKCGYSGSHLINVQKGLYQPTVEMLMAVCNAFNVNPKWLVDGDKNAPIFTFTETGHRETGHRRGVSSSKNRYYTGKANKQTIGKRILMLRLEQGITQLVFAQRIGLTEPTISSLEVGKTTLTEATAKKIGYAFDVGVDWLYYGDEKAREYPLDDEMIKWINSHPEVRKEIKRKMTK